MWAVRDHDHRTVSAVETSRPYPLCSQWTQERKRDNKKDRETLRENGRLRREHLSVLSVTFRRHQSPCFLNSKQITECPRVQKNHIFLSAPLEWQWWVNRVLNGWWIEASSSFSGNWSHYRDKAGWRKAGLWHKFKYKNTFFLLGTSCFGDSVGWF